MLAGLVISGGDAQPQDSTHCARLEVSASEESAPLDSMMAYSVCVIEIGAGNSDRYYESIRHLAQRVVSGSTHVSDSASLACLRRYQRCVEKRPRWGTILHEDVVAQLTELGIEWNLELDLEEAERYFVTAVRLDSLVLGPNHVDFGISLSNLGHNCSDKGDYEQADVAYRRALDIAEGEYGAFHPEVADALNNMAINLGDQGRYDEAELLHRRALKMNTRFWGRWDEACARSWNNLGLIHASREEHGRAIRCFRRALRIELKLGEAAGDVAMTLSNCANSLADRMRYRRAEKLYFKALETLDAEHSEREDLIFNLAVLYRDWDRHEQAAVQLKSWVDVKAEPYGEFHPEVARSWTNIGHGAFNYGRFSEAESAYQHALDLYRSQERVEEPVELLHHLSDALREQGKLEAAHEALSEAIELSTEQHGARDYETALLINALAVNHAERGNIAEAEAGHREALDLIAASVGTDNADYAMILNDLGLLYMDLGDLELAEERLSQALELVRPEGNEYAPNFIAHLNNMAVLNEDLGNWGAAESLHMEVLHMRQTHLDEGDASIAESLTNLANLYGFTGKSGKSIRFYEKALGIMAGAVGTMNPDYATLLNNIAMEYGGQGDLVMAEQFQREALGIQAKTLGLHHPDYHLSLDNLADIYWDAGEWGQVLQQRQEQFDLERDYIAESSVGLSREQRRLFWEGQNDLVLELLELADLDLDLDGPVGLGYDGILFGKGLLLDSDRELQEAVNQSGDTLAVQWLEELRAARQMVVRLDGELGADPAEREFHRAQAEQLEKKLGRKVKGFAAFQKRPELGWQDVQAKLGPEEVAVEFGQYWSSTEEAFQYVALVVNGDGELPKVRRLCTSAELALAWDALEGDDLTRAINTDLARSYELLWAPLESTLDSGQTVYYSGSGILSQLPFHAMYRTNAEGQRSYVMDRYDLRPLSTTRLVAEGRHVDADAVNGPLLSLGGVDYNDIPDDQPFVPVSREAAVEFERMRSQMKGARGMSDFLPFGPLVGTLREVQGINQKWRDAGMQVDQLGGSAASEHALKARLEEEVPAVLHIATHGFAFPDPFEEEDLGAFDQPEFRTYFRVGEDPLGRVGLILAGGNQSWVGRSDTMLAATGEDGILTAAEIADMDLRGMDLVVLSACETGLGELDGMEGTMGLFRAFKLAGVENVVQSFWSVPDKETQELMAAFYSRLTAGEDPQSAFSGAQKAMRNRYPNNPAKWAAFTLMR